ncbi:MAG: protease inhibitor I42 family protein [Peptococcaceae bacterium]|nr:protease inhibitor I42 family protein [Peptococcaceae bacterium]
MTSQNNPNNSITVVVGTAFDQCFQATPSAGYSWTIDNVPAEVRFLEKTLIPSARYAPGDPATVVFRFEPLSVGDYVIVFMYKRPWEKLGNTFTLAVKVLPVHNP